MIDLTLQTAVRFFDRLERIWEGARGRKLVAMLLVIAFLVALLVIELNRLGWLPASLGQNLPVIHLYAIEFAFNVLLATEVISLVFALAESVSRALGKQIEILSLILIRDVFKEFSHLSEPIRWEDVEGVLPEILVASVSALMIFVILAFYYRIQRHQPIVTGQREQSSFIAMKKLISLFILFSMVIILINDVRLALEGIDTSFFEAFFTVLIFTDILIVLISLRYSDSYRVAFRNSGFAVATALVRLALIAPIMVGAILGIGISLFALGLSAAYNLFLPAIPHSSTAEITPQQQVVIP
jgi:hypothetical protein